MVLPAPGAALTKKMSVASIFEQPFLCFTKSFFFASLVILFSCSHGCFVDCLIHPLVSLFFVFHGVSSKVKLSVFDAVEKGFLAVSAKPEIIARSFGRGSLHHQYSMT